MRIFRRSIEEFHHAVRPRLSREIKIKTSAEVVPSRDTQSHRVIDEEKLDFSESSGNRPVVTQKARVRGRKTIDRMPTNVPATL